MREFKFIRGKYTDENIFNTDETSNCLFAYDSKGDLVQFIEKNDKDFQEKFVGLSSDDRLSEIYTFRPSQFKISAQKESAGHYSFNFKADEDVYDGSRQFPADVITNAQTHIKSHTEAAFNTTSGLPILNLDGEVEQQTPMIFTFNNKKSFTRNLVFKVSGFLKERGYTTAQGENITAYPKSGDKIDFGGETGANAKSGTFHQGILQTAAPTKTGTIYRNVATVSSAEGSLTLAKNYVAGSGFKFIKDGSFETDIPYKDGLSFKLYKGVSGYLTEADADKAVTINNDSTGITEDVDYGNIYTPVVAEITTSYTINNGYVAYNKNETLTELIDGSNATVTVYERDTTKEVKSISSLEYDFYYVNSGDAYMLKGDCNVGDRANNQFVEGYANSYKNYYIFKNNKLSNISSTDLSDKDTITYYESKDHHIVGNGVYDDNDDSKTYVMFSDNWVEGIDINSENTLVNENNVPSPNTTEDVLRLITEVKVNATESD